MYVSKNKLRLKKKTIIKKGKMLVIEHLKNKKVEHHKKRNLHLNPFVLMIYIILKQLNIIELLNKELEVLEKILKYLDLK